MGTPVVRPLTAAQAAEGDEDWQDFLESQADQYDYLLLSLVCSFRPAHDGSLFVDAGIGIRLEAPDEPADRQPIAWSISPKKRAAPVSPSAQLKLTAKLMLVEAGVEYAPEQGGREELFVVGMGERDSDPEWRFSATASTPLVGDESLALIVRVPAGRASTGPHHDGGDCQTAPSRSDPIPSRTTSRTSNNRLSVIVTERFVRRSG
ncbi:hypothetical protein [Streptomyces somaliensis]|uniref:hypothetical protein n=1 Tax=Streptomyces somaliensis TaxID=78355 RepID=UPI0034E97B82|nr:hypothetical protein [Streptomyces somaliensis]